MSNTYPQITIRQATDSDASAVARLAERDSQRVPRGSLLLAYAGEQLMAAFSPRDGSAIADPFRATADLVEMLRIEAGFKRSAERPARRFWSRGGRTTAPRPSSPSVPGYPVLPGQTL